ncbi:ankyrin repeat-containing domain protein [Xylaria bambusicola]|uniref:ankyrin repeat-containing domain protein n=1 Tax=Xylaria bambusicola TaxID=326684 RepID=UPI00200753A1|nr:ankyrin repeat-containing domain protein [Xylaria bambusicola]KAI0528183.1 ankyrin repeat-containing domain protein [Xylaria bambusicola]
MSSGSSKPSEEQWLRHQAFIRRLYIVEAQPLRQIIDQLRDRGLVVTPSQLEYKVKKWNFQRNISKETWVEIDHCIGKRKREGKDSEVILCGKRLKPETIEKETDRYRDRSIFARFKSQPNGSTVIITNSHVSVSTPPSFSVEFEWPRTLPWLQFPESEIKIMLNKYMRIPEKIQREALVPAIFDQGIIGAMNTVQFNVSKLAAVIGALMPESYPQESLQRAQSLMNGSQKEFLFEAVSMVAYVLSNDVLDIHQGDEWRKIMTILKMSGLFKMQVNLKALKSHTINGFMENLYNAAIWRMSLTKGAADDRETMALLEWLLAVGQSPTLPHKDIFWRPHGPVGGPIGLELVSRLLKAGADPDTWTVSNICTQTILEHIIQQQSTSNSLVFCIAKLLLEHGASVRLDYALHAAIKRRHMDPALIGIIIQYGGNLLAELDFTREFIGIRSSENEDEWKWHDAQDLVYSHTALSVAAIAGLSQTQYVLNLLKHGNPHKSITDFITADVLISAVISKDFDTIRFLYDRSGSVGPNDFGIWPLHAAAYVDYLDICEIFFPSYENAGLDVTSTFSPLHFACFHANLEVPFSLLNFQLQDAAQSAILLIDAGAKPDKNAAKAVTSAAMNFDVAFLSTLFGAGINPNERNFEGHTPLQQVLREERKRQLSKRSPVVIGVTLYDSVKLLLENGATLSGDEIIWAIRTKNWDVVTLILEYGGDLSSADQFGTALEAAIRSRDITGITRLFDIMPTVYDAGSLCAAIEIQQHSIVHRLLLNRRAQPAMDELEVTAIGIAAKRGHIDLLRSLLQYPPLEKTGPMPILYVQVYSGDLITDTFKIVTEHESFRDQDHLCGSPLAPMATENNNETFEACSMLLRNGFKPDRLTWAIAADSNNIAFVQFLLNNSQRYEEYSGPDDYHPSNRNPLLGAIRHNNTKLAALLLEAGVDVNDHRTSIRYSISPLQLAVEMGNFEFVRFLIKANADVNSPPADESGATALQMAAIGGHLGIAKYLLDLGAEVNAPGSQYDGRTALEGAAEWGRLDMLELLLSNGACTTGSWRSRAASAVAFALKERHYTAAGLLKESLNWSEEDETRLKENVVAIRRRKWLRYSSYDP